MILPRVRRVFCCPYCSFISQAAEQVRSHTISQHAVQPKFRCPLCQEQLMGRPNLRFHLTHIHNVVSECVERLLLVASTVETTFPTKVVPSPNLPKARDPPDTSSSHPASDRPKDAGDVSLLATSESTCEKKPDGSPAGKEPVARDSAEAEDPEEAEKDETEKDTGVLPCPLCRQRAESFPELREHLENEHPELSHAEIQQLCGPAEAAGGPGEEEGEMEEEMMEEMEEGLGRSSSPPDVAIIMEEKQMPADLEVTATPTAATPSALLDPRQPVSYRKSTNFALDKFLDPSRPYKCTVCKESFTQKNILLVHYNSVSHLHKMKKASIDPSLPSRAEVTTAQDKPFKCTVCRVSYNQSSTLEIHMRSVLHQTRSRVAKLEAAGRSTPDPNAASGTEKSDNGGSSGHNPEHGGKNIPAPSSSPKCETTPVEVKMETAGARDLPSAEPMRKALESQCLGVPGLPFVSPQMHLSMDLHRQASLLQSPLFTPPMLPPFPLGPETLLKLQQHQQQLLLPFYLHDLKVNPDIGMQGGPSILSLPGASPMLIGGGSLMKHPQVMVKDEPQQPMAPPSSSLARLTLVGSDLAAAAESESPTDGSSGGGAKEDGSGAGEPTPVTEETAEIVKEEPPPQLGDSKVKEADREEAANAMPPPRVPTDISRTASKALLENFGFELVIQYNEGKQHLLPAHPPLFSPQPAPQPSRPLRSSNGEHGGRGEKLKCESCGKLFSNMLILKTHEEHVHRRFLPFEALSRYAAQFRKSYDSMYAPKQQAVPAPSETPIAQKTPQLPPEAPQQPTPIQIPQLPIPLDFSLCPSFLMQPISLQAMPPALPTMEELMSAAALAQAQTVDPAELETGESRSPRTRITPEQLKVLWNYFDINNLPSEEKILQMSEHTGLSTKVVKHWFRNRLFKERQQDKDSPYNFSTPPTAVVLPEGEEAGEGGPTAAGAPQTPNTDLNRCDRWGSRRFSRTKFSDFQFQALQSFFETSAYPKDSEVEKLSQLLGLPNRVVVVWFQNARQKARKNAADSPFHAGEKGKELGAADRCVISGSKQSACKKCHLTFLCIFKLIHHLKKCYNDQLAEEDAEDGPGAQELPEGTGCTSQNPPPSTAMLPPPETNEVQAPQDVVAAPVPTANDEEETPMEEEVGEGPDGAVPEREGEAEKVEEPIQSAETTPDQLSEEPEADMSTPVPAEQPQPAEQASTSPPPQPMTPPPELPKGSESANIYSCDQCQVSFANPDLLGKHQSLHILASTQLPGHLLDMPLLMFDHNSSLLASSLLPGSFGTLPSPLGDHMAAAGRKRKHDEDSLSPTESEAGYLGDEQPKDKRLRTTILPEQLEILHRWYMQDSNPTRKMLDRISEEVALKKRVVQVWFQNTRARERKGQFRCVAPIPSPKPYPKFIPLGKPEALRDLPRHMVEASPGPLLAHRSPSLQVLRETAAFYYNASGIHTAVPPPAPPKGNPSPCQATPPTQAFTMKTEVCCAVREPAMPDPTPAEPAADSAAVTTQEPMEEESRTGEPVPLPATTGAADTDENSQRMSPPPAAMEADERSPGDLSDSSSMADPESPNPANGNAQHRYSDGGMDALGQRRFRTQMSSLQLKIMKACYANYRTPTMNECEMLGNEIGLQKRVIQVWFQNARAKEKKAKLQGLPPPMGLDVCSDTPRTECTYCHIKYDFYVSCRSHIFSRQHIAKLREAIQKQLKHEIKYYDLAPASSAGAGVQQPPKTELKPGASMTGGGGHPTGYPPMGFQNVSTAGSAALPRLAPVLLSSQGSPTPLGGLAPFNAGSTSSLLGIAASVTPSLLPVPSHPVPPKAALDQTATSEFTQEARIEKDRQQHQKSDSPQPNQAQKNQPETPILSGMANTKNLKNLQAAITGGAGPPPLLGGQFLPFPLPGTPPMFSPQIQGAYFQQLYGMKKSLFPMNPVIPQTLISLLPNSLVQPEAPHLKQPKLEPAMPARSSPPATAGREQLPEADEAQVTSEDFLLLQSAGVSTVDVAHKYLCRQCKAPFDEESQAAAHQDDVCFHRAGAPPPLRVPVCTYHCLACEVLLSGTEDLTQHLRSGAHKRETLRKNNSSFAKEEANIPHTDPSPNRASTSVLVAL